MRGERATTEGAFDRAAKAIALGYTRTRRASRRPARTRLGGGLHDQAEIMALLGGCPTPDGGAQTDLAGPAYLSTVATLNRNLGAMPVQPGNRVDVFTGYAESLAAMTDEVERATASVHVEFYIAAWDATTAPFYDALVRAVERGVAVRLLFDHLGSRVVPGYKAFQRRLSGTGIAWHPMLSIHPLKGEWRRPDLRNHRKLLVVDGRVGFTGSQNLIEAGYHKSQSRGARREYLDLMARVEGPVVSALALVFAADWFAETGVKLTDELRRPTPIAGSVPAQVIPSGPGFATGNNLRAFTMLLYSAQRRLSMTTPYFVPDESLLYAVTTAAQRGLDVELFVSAIGDQFMVHHAQRSYYEGLLRAGVRIYLYPAPYILHSKFFTVDDDVAVLGSSNLDMRSFSLNYEVSLMLPDRDVVARLRQVEDTNRARSRELTLERWLSRSRGSTFAENAMRLTAALQ